MLEKLDGWIRRFLLEQWHPGYGGRRKAFHRLGVAGRPHDLRFAQRSLATLKNESRP